MNLRSAHTHALSISMIVGGILVSTVLFFWRTVSIPEEYLPNILLVVLLFCVALVTVALHQSLKIYESADSLAKGMTKDMLVQSHELFSELYRSSPVPYILIAENGNIESVNFASARLFHVEVEALNELNIFDFIEGENMQKIALIPEYFKQGKFVNDVEVQIRRPDGMRKWAMLSLFSFKDAHGTRKGLLTLVDITKQKLVDKAKTEFVSLASHQLRTPISAMKWNIELLATAGKDTLSSLQSAYLNKISHSLDRMDLLVGDFLSASKFELGTLTATRAPVDAHVFLTGVYQELFDASTQRHVRIEPDVESARGVIATDSHLLHMIVSNVLGNAIKYTPEGGIVRFKAVLNDTQIELNISDTGIGIPDEDQDMIFSKLFRASNARTQETDGTGLGLYIVKEAVKILGGTISFTSKKGVGTTFTIVLPK